MNTYDKGMELEETAQEVASDLAAGVKEQAEIGKQKLAEFNDKAISYVKDHPWMSVSLSLGIGALLGFLCRSK